MHHPTIYWTPRSRNTKTGDIPQGYIGATKKETRATCQGCPTEPMCYYWNGATQMAHAQIRKSAKAGKDYTLSNAINKSLRSANYVRAAVGGDPHVFDASTVASWHSTVIEHGLRGLIIYTHFPDDKGAHLKGLALASTESPHHADKLSDEGWKVALRLPYRAPHTHRHKAMLPYSGQKLTTPAGRKIPICPAQIKRGVTCNTCGWCSATATKKPTPQLVGFLTQ